MSFAPQASPATPRPRAEWVDVARALAMFFIMWLHTRNAPVAIHPAVGGAIGLFFLMAGYFMPREAKPCALRALQLARVWLIWLCIPPLIYLMGDVRWDWYRVIGIGEASYNAPMWFLRNLVVFQLIMAGLMLLRFLPRYAPILAITLCSCAYITEWPEHIALRFDYMMMLALGFALRVIPLARIHTYLKSNGWVLMAMSLVILIQAPVLKELALTFDLHYRVPNIPVRSMCYSLMYLLVAIGVATYCPRLAHPLAVAGRCMMFTFVSHIVFYGFIVQLEGLLLGGYVSDGPWTPILVMAGLTLLCLQLQRRFPRAMRWLFLN